MPRPKHFGPQISVEGVGIWNTKQQLMALTTLKNNKHLYLLENFICSFGTQGRGDFYDLLTMFV